MGKQLKNIYYILNSNIKFSGTRELEWVKWRKNAIVIWIQVATNLLRFCLGLKGSKMAPLFPQTLVLSLNLKDIFLTVSMAGLEKNLASPVIELSNLNTYDN